MLENLVLNKKDGLPSPCIPPFSLFARPDLAPLPLFLL